MDPVLSGNVASAVDLVRRRSRLTRLFRRQPLRFLPSVIVRRVGREGALLAEEVCTRLASREDALRVLEKGLSSGSSLKTVTSQMEWAISKWFYFSRSDRAERIRILTRDFADSMVRIVSEADRVLEHRFDLLGSGPIRLGDLIDWHLDFKSGHRWNATTYHKRISPAEFPGGYDIKVPWELSRFQHLPRLGQAYWITGDEKYACEFVRQVTDWIDRNPWPLGVNWACTMDVAIRAANWLMGIAFFLGSPSLSPSFLRGLAASLLTHGRHIRGNLEYQRAGRPATNHYLADLTGLFFLGTCLPFLGESREWLQFASTELWKEILLQTYSDGVGFEGSIAYHRLSLEFALCPAVLCHGKGIALPAETMARLEKMLEFTLYYTKPDGTAPMIGDADNGRLFRLHCWQDADREWLDHRYLLAMGAILFGREDFAQGAGDQWQDAYWLLGSAAREVRQRGQQDGTTHELPSRVFPQGGVAVMRGPGEYLVLDAGLNGQNGNGGHGHNDALSFELHVESQPWIVDPGSYLYTADFRARNLFRSTAYHNTIMIDSEEINRLCDEDLFRLEEDAKPTICAGQAVDEFEYVEAEHRGYERLANGVRHRRGILHDKSHRCWFLIDWLEGHGLHGLELRLHFAPGIQLLQLDHREGFVAIAGAERHLLVVPVHGVGWSRSVGQGWVSPSYGKRKEATVACFSILTDVPSRFVVALYPTGVAECQPDATLCEQTARWYAHLESRINPRV